MTPTPVILAAAGIQNPFPHPTWCVPAGMFQVGRRPVLPERLSWHDSLGTLSGFWIPAAALMTGDKRKTLGVEPKRQWCYWPWQRLYFLPLPQGHRSLRPILWSEPWTMCRFSSHWAQVHALGCCAYQLGLTMVHLFSRLFRNCGLSRFRVPLQSAAPRASKFRRLRRSREWELRPAFPSAPQRR